MLHWVALSDLRYKKYTNNNGFLIFLEKKCSNASLGSIFGPHMAKMHKKTMFFLIFWEKNAQMFHWVSFSDLIYQKYTKKAMVFNIFGKKLLK